MSRKLKPLAEHNAERRATLEIEMRLSKPRNGIACPHCGDELVDSRPNITTSSHPPLTEVECFGCGFRDYRVV